MEGSLHGHLEDEEEEDEVQKAVVVGKTYNCVFCRRGFTTAQALGGHMNVHRRARVSKSTKPSSPSSSYNSNMSYPLPPHHGHRASKVGKCKGGSKGGNGEGRGMRLGFQDCGDGGNGEVKTPLEGQCEDLDLELRLGHHSYF